MRDAEKGKFRYVVAWKSNRMGRNMLQAMMNEAKLNDMGIRVLYTEEDFDKSEVAAVESDHARLAIKALRKIVKNGGEKK